MIKPPSATSYLSVLAILCAIIALAAYATGKFVTMRHNPPPPKELNVRGHDFWIIGTGHATNYVHSPECQNPKCAKP